MLFILQCLNHRIRLRLAPFPVWLLGLLLFVFPAWAGYDLRDNARDHNQEGIDYLNQGQPLEAIAEFQAGLRLKPSISLKATLENNLGLAALAAGQYALAFESFQKACHFQPTYLLFRQNLAHAYLIAGMSAQAQGVLRDALSLNEGDAEAWLLLGLLYREEENAPLAEVCFRQFLKLQPESEMARAVRRMLGPDKARRAGEPVEKSPPDKAAQADVK